jgi:small conductance mechanosensitive channel
MNTVVSALGLWLHQRLHLGEAMGVLLARGLAIVATLLLAFLAYRLISGVIDRLLRPVAASADYTQKVQRALTLGPLMKSAATYLLAFITLMIVLQQVGIDVQAILVSAGVVGLAIGLGAQSLIKDVITGFFLLFEGLIAVGDTIEVGPHAGVVESIGLRVTTLRTFSGAQRIIPNGELTQFSNLSRGWGRAVVEVGIAYEEDVSRALSIMDSVGRAWAAGAAGQALEPPQAEGIMRFGESEVVLRLHAKVNPQSRLSVEQELRKRIKAAFEAERIMLPKKLVYVLNDRETGGSS